MRTVGTENRVHSSCVRIPFLDMPQGHHPDIVPAFCLSRFLYNMSVRHIA